MKPQTPNYLIYPSLLDKFQGLKDAKEYFDSFLNQDTEGVYKETLEELEERFEQELLDAINRKPHEVSEAADKGTCFNEVVDCAIMRTSSTRQDVALKSVYDEFEAGRRLSYVNAEMDGLNFAFDGDFCLNAIDYFKGSLPQYKCHALLETRLGLVELYGYVDYIRADVVYDMKTTKSYEFGKYAKYWQRFVYPYCLIESGDVTEVREFEFSVYALSGGTSRTPLISGQFYRERYDYNHQDAKNRLCEVCEEFILWLEQHRDQITDKKIFNQL